MPILTNSSPDPTFSIGVFWCGSTEMVYTVRTGMPVLHMPCIHVCPEKVSLSSRMLRNVLGSHKTDLPNKLTGMRIYQYSYCINAHEGIRVLLEKVQNKDKRMLKHVI